MNHLNKTTKGKNRFLSQLVLVSLFIVFPVIMIFYNGNHAVKGILWEGAEEQTAFQEKTNTNPIKKLKSIEFGIYDPENHFLSDSIFQVEHIFISWTNYNRQKILDNASALRERNTQLFITIEPHALAERNDELFEDILHGSYDTILLELGILLNEFESNVYLSWGHEMDQDLAGRYPWSEAEPKEYISSYRYVVDYLNEAVKNDIRWIWSPIVVEDCKKYWPGPEYADYIGMPIYSFPKLDKITYGTIRSFSTIYQYKYDIIKSLDKPIIITEMGINGSLDFQDFWLSDAFVKMKSIPEIEGVFFFYAKDKESVWGNQVETPDWRFNDRILRSLVIWLQENR
jgi:beta-mannanase